MSENIVGDWLRSLRLVQYAESFLDNGYDDLEICKQIGEPDLDAIGVGNPAHRAELLRAVRVLREQGGTAVYFTLEEAQQQQQQQQQLLASQAAGEGVTALGGLVKECSGVPNYSTYMYDDDLALVAKARAGNAGEELLLASPTEATGLEQSLFRKYVDEYEEGKAELAKIPRLQLKGLLRDRLVQDGVRLSSPPYSNADGSKGYLDGLAVKYAEEFKTIYQDIVEHLESLRRKEVEEAMSTQVKLAPAVENVYQISSCHSSPIYKPGKYSPSSCLSDQEEEEIYGYGYGVYARRIYKHRANRLACIATPQRCLNPRSQCFYEPCSFNSTAELKEVEPSCEPTKKRGPLGRILRGLVLKREKEKNKEKNNPRHLTPTKSLPPRIPDPSGSPLYEGVYATREMRAAAEERMKLVLMVKDGQISMEQAFDKMCQYEPLRWKHNPQEEILKDFRHGVMNITPKKTEAKETAKFYTTVETSYPHGARSTQHWYDDPPYESDLEDSGPYSLRNPKTSISMPYVETSGFPNGSCLRGDGQPHSSWIYSGDSVIMTRTAGDIQVARDQIRPKSCESRLSEGIRNSNASVETSASSKRESLESSKEDGGASSPVQGRKNKGNTKFKSITGKTQSASEEALSLSSDYEDQEDSERKGDRRLSRDLNGRASSFVGRMKGFGNDVKKKISKLRPSRTASESEAVEVNQNAEPTITTSTSSVESLPSGSGSSIQALTTSSSNRSSTSVEEEAPAYTGPFIGKARALVDYTPSPYDKDALKFKKGDVIDIITMSQTGSWTGMLNNRVGHFKFINVEAIPEPKPRPRRSLLSRRRNSKRGKPKSVEELLQRINLEEHISVFVLNGYENLDLFKELEEEDLDYLGITDSEHRAKILTAVELLHDYDSPDSPEADDEPTTDGESYPDQSDASKLSGDSVLVHKPPHSPRDSGCYASNENLPHRESLQQGTTHTGSGDISQSESGIHSSDGMDGLTPAPSNNLDVRETPMLSLGNDKRLFLDSAEHDGNTLVTRAVIETVSKHSYQPNILPNTVGLQSEETLSSVSSLLNGPSEAETSLNSKYASKIKPNLSNAGRPLHPNSAGKTETDWEHCQSSNSVDSLKFSNDSSEITIHQSTASPTLTRDHLSLRSRNSDLTYAMSNVSISQGSLKGGRLNPSSHPTTFVQQGSSDGNPPSSKSSTMPHKQGTPSKIKIPHLPTQLSNKKLIAFKEPSVLPKKGRNVATMRIPRPVSSSLDSLLQRKLQEELIDLSQEPYTDRMGFCGIPPALVQRYSEETKCDVKEVADTLDHIRILHLQQLGRQGVPNDFLADSCFCPMQETDYLSLDSWLVSVGLPMYTELLCCAGHTRLGDIVHLKESDLRACGISNAAHLRRLVTEIEALNIHLQKFGC